MATNFGQAGTAFILLEADWKGFTDGLRKGTPQANAAAAALGDSAGKTAGQKFSQGAKSGLAAWGESLGKFSASAKNIGRDLSIAISAPIAALGGLGLAFNAMEEQAQVSFTTLLGDAGKAKTFLNDLKDFASRTPFEFPGLVKASQRLLAMGFAADQIMPTLTAVGNAASGLGGSQETIDRITLALGQMQGRGKVSTQEMNQLTEAGIKGWTILAESIGVSESKLRDMVEKGVVPADRAVKELLAAMNKKGSMEDQAKTFTGLMSTIKDEARFASGALTKGLFLALKDPMEAAIVKLREFRMELEGMSDSSKAAIGIGGLVAAGIGPALFVFGTLAGSIKNIIDLLTLMKITSVASFGAFASAAIGVLARFAAPFVLWYEFRNLSDKNEKGYSPKTVRDANAAAVEKLKRMEDPLGLGPSITGAFTKSPDVIAAAYKSYPPGKNDPWNLGGGTDKAKTDPVQQFVKSVIKEENEAANLEKALGILESSGISAAAIQDKLGAAIRDAAKEAALMGETLGPLTEKHRALMVQQEANIFIDEELIRLSKEAGERHIETAKMFDEATKEYAADMAARVEVTDEARKAQEHLNDANITAASGGARGREAGERMRDMRESIAETTAAVEHFAAQGWTADQLLEEFGSDIERNAEYVEIYGGTLSETEMQLLAFGEATAKAKARTEEFRDAWGDAFGGIVDGLVDMIVNFDFSMKSLGDLFKDTAKDLATSFLDGFFQPVKDGMKELGKDLATEVGSVFFGGEKKEGKGGLFSGLSGALGGLFGGGKKDKGPSGEELGAWLFGDATGPFGGGGGLGGNPNVMGGGFTGGMGGIAGQAMSKVQSLMNPIQQGLDIANSTVQLYNSTFGMIGKGRKSAKEIVKSQNAFSGSVAEVFEDTGLSADDKSRLIEAMWAEYQQNLATFAGSDKNSQKVANQAFATLTPWISDIRKELAPQLKAAEETAAAAPFAPFDAAVMRFDAAVLRFEALAMPAGLETAVEAPNLAMPTLSPAGDLAAATALMGPEQHPSTTPQINVAPGINLEINVDAGIQFDARKLKQWFLDNYDGITAAVIQGIRRNEAGVVMA